MLTAAFTECNNLAVAPGRTQIAYSPANYVLPEKGPIHLRDLRTGVDTTLKGEYEAASLAISADGRWLASGNRWGEICLWRLPAHQPVLKFRAHGFLLLGLAFSPDGKLLATAGNDQLIHLWEVGTTNIVRTLRGHLSEVWSLDFSRDGQTLISASKDGTAKLWNVEPPPPNSHTLDIPSQATPLGPSTDGRTLVTLDEGARITQLWSLPDGQLIGSNTWRQIDQYGCRNVAFMPENQAVVSVSSNGTVHLWSLMTGAHLRALELGATNVVPWRLSLNNRWLLDGPSEEGALLWDLAAVRPMQQFPDCRRGAVVVFSPDSRWLAYDTPNYAVKVWDLEANREKVILRGQSWRIMALGYSPDSRLLASGGIDAHAWLWSIESGQPLFSPFTGHLSGVNTVAFSGDGKTLMTRGDEDTVRWWQIATGREMLWFPDGRIPMPIHVPPSEANPGASILLWKERSGRIQVTTLQTIAEIDAAEKAHAGASVAPAGVR